MNAPEILLLNQQGRWKVDLSRLKHDLEKASSVLPLQGHIIPEAIKQVEFSLVTPSSSLKIHRDFFKDASATDVMTFPTEPIASVIICPEIARHQRDAEGLSVYEEVLTYAIHGMLHLSGLNDLKDMEFERMRREQTAIRKQILSESPAN
ncbi:MAG: rRNA maturation RNase YbeY [Verrucomicrobiota bacterium]